MPGVSLKGIALAAATLATCAEAFSGKVYAAGSGQDMMSLPETVSEILELSGQPSPTVLYLGTATYDEAGAEHTQTKSFIEAGCNVTSLPVAVNSPSEDEMKAAFDVADIVLVSGGNTLFAVDRWEKLGIPALLKDALARGAVLCGGSAGGIVWFDGGFVRSVTFFERLCNQPLMARRRKLGCAVHSNNAFVRAARFDKPLRFHGCKLVQESTRSPSQSRHERRGNECVGVHSSTWDWDSPRAVLPTLRRKLELF